MLPKQGEPIDIHQLRAINAANGYHFFDNDAMRFFRSRVDYMVYTGTSAWYFVTSEQFESVYSGYRDARKYTVRAMYCDGHIEEPESEGFQKYATLRQARRAAKAIAEKDTTRY